MIVRTWSGRVPSGKAEDFRNHLMATGVADYLARPGALDVAMWQRNADGWAVFTLVSTWQDMESICAYAGADPTRAVLYPGDEAFDLVPDTLVTHHDLIKRLPCAC